MADKNNFKEISKEKFAFVQSDTTIFDEKFETKPIGYLQDAWIRFKKNKGSVVAACIIIILVLFAIFAPIFSRYDLSHRDGNYSKLTPLNNVIAPLGFWDGTKTEEKDENMYYYLQGIFAGQHDVNGLNPLVKATYIGKSSDNRNDYDYYKIKYNTYYEVGFRYKNLDSDEYADLLRYQNETGIQVIYPMNDISESMFPEGLATNLKKSWYENIKNMGESITPNIWYKVKDRQGLADLDEDGNFVNNYFKLSGESNYSSLLATPEEKEAETQLYEYYVKNQGGYRVRILYYRYYEYLHGFEPRFLFGTNDEGQDIYTALALGARLSFLLALCVSAINFIIGAIYGSIEGYYGGTIDLVMERISDILSGIPFTVVAVLFQLHLSSKVGVVGSLIFAFVLTGWIGIASRVRTQFYRYKGQEYVLAARTLGAKDRRLIFKHIFPNALGTLITGTILMIPGVIFSESSLSYLGIINLSNPNNPNLTSIGLLLAQGNNTLKSHPHIILFPSIFISLLMISFNLFGNGLRDAFNPSLRGAEE